MMERRELEIPQNTWKILWIAIAKGNIITFLNTMKFYLLDWKQNYWMVGFCMSSFLSLLTSVYVHFMKNSRVVKQIFSYIPGSIFCVVHYFSMISLCNFWVFYFCYWWFLLLTFKFAICISPSTKITNNFKS